VDSRGVDSRGVDNRGVDSRGTDNRGVDSSSREAGSSGAATGKGMRPTTASAGGIDLLGLLSERGHPSCSYSPVLVQ